jgi:hypothetical protein
MVGAWTQAEMKTEHPLSPAAKASKSFSPKKLRGCIAAPPRVPFKFPKEAYLFFLAFFFAAILFSSELFKFSASIAGGARIQSSCLR